MRYTTYGSVRGMGPIRETLEEAERDLTADQTGCRKQGGYSDRSIAYVGDDSYLYHDEDCQDWIAGPGGRTSGGIQVS